jgi:Protein of unknown function (DUF2442)
MNELTPRIAEANYAGDYRIWLRFADGVEGEIDLEPELWGEMFEPLKDKALFAQFQLYPERSTIFWPNEADLAPEFLYDKFRQRKRGQSAAE